MDEQEDLTSYMVVLNHEEQYSIWPADRENPLGWSDAGKSGTEAECLASIEEVWPTCAAQREAPDEGREPGELTNMTASDAEHSYLLSHLQEGLPFYTTD